MPAAGRKQLGAAGVRPASPGSTGGLARLLLEATPRAGRRFLVSGCGTSATILPGLKMFCGSNIRFTSWNTSYSGPYLPRRNQVRLSPTPCSPLIVPAHREHLVVQIA